MNGDTGNPVPNKFEAIERYVPLLSWAIVLFVLLVIPFKITGYGYLPSDDALRHAAKAVSGKPWQDILVLGPAFHFDPNWGWHWFLRQIHLTFNLDAEPLVVCTVIALFIITNWSIAVCLKRPEAWLAAFVLVALISDMTSRFLLGRPFLLSIAALGIILLVWQRQRGSPPKWNTMLWMTGLLTGTVFLHGVWYLWALPIAAFFFAREFKWCFMLAASWVVGTFLGSALTGHPIVSILQAIELALNSLGMHGNQFTLVGELKPSGGEILPIIFVGGLVVIRQLARLPAPPLSRHPAFWLAALGWLLGCQTFRFWEDWGAPALMILIATDLQLLFEAKFPADSFRRLGLAVALCAAAWAVTTNDIANRWTNNLSWRPINTSDPAQTAALQGWLPEKGGIFYTADSEFFFQTFFYNPGGDWRYALGFESTLMTPDNFKTYQDIVLNLGDAKAYQPWLEKMQPQDRLVIQGGAGDRPNIPQLEWARPVGNYWIGRLPKNPSTR
ncbi:MAG TPA: hypothetical protein VGI03_06645 [Verrucomicrobiae bacterium]|jgi:hypothetical protein